MKLLIKDKKGKVEELDVDFWSFFKLSVASYMIILAVYFAVGFVIGVSLLL